MVRGSWKKHSSNAAAGTAHNKTSAGSVARPYIKKGPGLEYFLHNSINKQQVQVNESATEEIIIKENHPYINDAILDGFGRKGIY